MNDICGLIHVVEAWVHVPKKPDGHTMKQIGDGGDGRGTVRQLVLTIGGRVSGRRTGGLPVAGLWCVRPEIFSLDKASTCYRGVAGTAGSPFSGCREYFVGAFVGAFTHPVSPCFILFKRRPFLAYKRKNAAFPKEKQRLLTTKVVELPRQGSNLF